MNCPNCNQPVEPSAVFCGNCGQQLQQTAPPQAPFPAQAAPVGDPASMQPPTPFMPTAPNVPTVPMAPGQPYQYQQPQGQHVPAYAVGSQQQSHDSKLLTYAVIFGALALPGAIVPLLGLGFGIAAIVLASKHHHAGTGRMVVAIVLASLGILLSLIAWGYNINKHFSQTGLAPRGSITAAASALQSQPSFYRTIVTVNN